ncbi:MAG: GNAT family N-acetyltransferase [Phycisphaeraceae bacterium]|nr:GNAT family N-acetyltransferase [Phycisphaeraceae bacterium]
MPPTRSIADLDRLGLAASLARAHTPPLRPPGQGPIRSLFATRVPVQPRTLADRAVITTDRMILRPLLSGDCVEFLRVVRLNHRPLARFFPIVGDGESSLRVFTRQMRLTTPIPHGPNFRRAAFAHDGRMVGAFNLNTISRGLEFRAELTFWVSVEFQNQGYATEGVAAITRFAFTDLRATGHDPGGLGLHRLDALVCPENSASRRILTCAGFAPRSPALRLPLDIRGRPVDHDLYSLFAPLEPAAPEPLLEFKLLPIHQRLLMAEQIGHIRRADPVDAVHSLSDR